MRSLPLIWILLLCGLAARTEASEIVLPELRCLPNEGNAVVRATVDGAVPGGEVRLYFRRLNPAGQFFWVRMEYDGSGYWAALPKPEERDQPELTDGWWQVLANRDWMAGRDREWLAGFLRDQDHEAAEIYVAILDGYRNILRRSPTVLVPVVDEDDCEPQPSSENESDLTPAEQGFANNLTIGETTKEQRGRAVFHWLCDGIVTRVGVNPGPRPDEYCRPCVAAKRSIWARIFGRRDAVDPAADEGEPEFPWPPPEPSTRRVQVSPQKVLADLDAPPHHSPTLWDFRLGLGQALSAANYDEGGLYKIVERDQEGFALVTALERIDDEGNRTGMWGTHYTSMSILERVERSFAPDSYRAVVFTVTHVGAYTAAAGWERGEDAKGAIVRLSKQNPMATLETFLKETPATEVEIMALVYVFEAHGRERPVDVKMLPSPEQAFTAAGLWGHVGRWDLFGAD